MSKSIKAVAKIVTAPIKALYDPVGAFKDVFGGVKDIFAGLTGAAKVSSGPGSEPSSQTVRSSKAPARFILGKASTGGVLAWVQEQLGGQTTGEWLHIVYVLSEGAIAGVDEIYVDEQPISTLGAFATYEVVIDPTTPNDFLLKNCPDWRAEQIGRNLSFVRVSFLYNSEKFPSGIPDVRFVVRGRSDIYDPRDGQSKYSANTALLILWYLRNRCGIPDDEIIFETFASAANISDELVTDPQGNRAARYFAGAVIGADEKRNSVLENLLSACAGTLIRVGGRWSLQVGAYYGPADFTITEDMVIGTVEGTTEVSNSDAINTIRGTFIDPSQAWADTDYPEVSVQTWIDSDGGELAESQSFSYVTDAYLAQRLANIALRRRRSGGTLSMPLNFNGYNCRPGRAVSVNLPSLNILGEFIVTDWAMGAMDACKVTLKPYEQAIFDDAVGQPYDPLGFINLPVGGLAAVTNLAWTPATASEVIQGVLSWTPPAQTVLSYTVVIRQGGVVVQALKVGGEASTCNVNGLNSGVYALSVICYGPGTMSGEATINVSVDVPPMPESCLVSASVSTITLVPRNSQGLNGGTYEYFLVAREGAPVSEAVYLGQGMSFTHTGLGFAQEYFYYVRSANAYGKSPFLFVRAATSSDPREILDVIKGEILESDLGKELTSKIELIDGNGPGSVNERVGTAKTELAKQISEVNNALADTKSNLQQQITSVGQSVADAKAELQQQITAVSTLAGSLPYRKDKTYSINQSALGSDGKLYQALKAVPLNTPPPNATYWTDVGQAVVTANGIAARVSKVETDVSTLDGKTTAQASQIQSLQTSLTATDKNVAKKADATVVDSLTLRVSDAEGKLTSEGKRIDGLQTSLDGKASSTALQQVTARVTATEQKDAAQDQQLTSQSQALTSLTDSVSKKAEAATVQALSNDVKQQGQTLEAQGQSLTKINASLPFLSGENLLANSSFEDLIADGSRPTHWAISGAAARSFVPSPLTSSLKALRVSANIGSGNYIEVVSSPVDGRPRVKVTEGVTYTLSVYARGSSALAYMRMYLQFLDASGTVLSAPTNADRIVLTDNFVRYTLTGTAPTAATQVNVYAARLFNDGSASTLLWMELDNVQLQEGLVSTAYQPSIVATADASAEAITGITGRVEKTEQGLSSTGQQITQLTNSLDTTNQNVAGAQKSAQEALSEVAKKADVSALQTLGSKVEQQGKDLASTGQAITRIDTAIASSGSENLLFNPSFDTPSTGNPNIAEGWTWRNTSGTSVTPTLRSSDLGAEGKCQRLDVAGLSADSSAQYVDFVPESGRRPPIYPGVAVTASIYIRGNSGLMVQIYLQFKDAAGNTLLTNGPTNSNLDPTYRRPFLISAVAPEGSVRVDVLYRIRSGPGSSVVSGFVDFDMAQLEQGTTLTGWRDNGKANAYGIAVNAAATSALTGRVEDNERGLTSTSGQLTQLENSIGDVGGENLFYNPAFTQYASANGSPEGWATEGPVTSTDTIVPSWLNSGEKAQRIVAPGLTSSNQYKSLRPVGSRRIKVSEGQPVTASVYARKSEGNIGMRIFIQWISSSDAVLGAPASNLTSLTTAGARLSFSAVAPAGAVEAYVYFRTYAMTATATNGTVEYARPQAEYGTRATGWRDNSQVVAAQQAVTSAAVESLNSTVSQQGNTLSSVSGRTTSLENAINSTSSGLATKASAESVSSLGNRVKQTEEGLSSQSSQVTQLKNSISGLQPFVAGRSWEFTGSTRGWVATETGSNFTAGPLFGTISKPSNLQCNFAPAISGAENPYLRVRLRRRNTSRSGAQMYWANEDGGLAEARRMAWTIDTTSTDWQDIEIDLAGHSGWNGKSITAIRLDMMNTANVSGEIDIAYIAVGRRSAAASAQALSSMESEVSQQGSKLTAETKRIDGLYASVDSANAAVQSEAKTRADADSAIGKQMETVQSNLGSTNAAVQQISAAQSSLNGKVNASYTVRLQAMANGQWAMAGIGAGIDNNGGILQSTVAVIADRFAVMNPAGTGMILPFAIQNGQVVMNEALISKALIQNAIVGSTIASAAQTNWGPPVFAIDFQSGLQRIHHPTKANHYVSFDRNGITLTAGAVNVVEMSFD